MITVKAKILKNWKAKSEGLLGAKKAEAIYFKTHFGIHTFFMKFPIDVVILDKSGIVKALKANLKPGNVFLWNPLYSGVLELPSGGIKSNKITKGSKIKITSNP